jgi:N-acetylmuramoyl-L-alanine amidase
MSIQPRFPQPPQPQPKGGEKMIVCIDPGHGGPDPGAVSPSGIQEKKITLTVAKRVAEYLRRAGSKWSSPGTQTRSLSPATTTRRNSAPGPK